MLWANYGSSGGADGRAGQCFRHRSHFRKPESKKSFLVLAITVVAERQMSSMHVITIHIKATAALNEIFVTSVASLHAPVMHIVRGNGNVGSH